VALAVAVIATLTLCGCVPPSPAVIPTAVPTATPIFASDADALAAAKKVFQGYVEASDAIGNDGGARPERIAPWVTPSRLTAETREFADFAKTGERLSGSSVLSRFELQQLSQTKSGLVRLTVYVCDDVSGSRLISPTGIDITPALRTNVIPLQVHFENATSGSQSIRVGGSDPWRGSNFCF
jgi:hypothetical protein